MLVRLQSRAYLSPYIIRAYFFAFKQCLIFFIFNGANFGVLFLSLLILQPQLFRKICKVKSPALVSKSVTDIYGLDIRIMASMYYDKKGKRWRVCWHVTLPDGTVDTGSKTFGRDKKTAKRFKDHCENRAKQLKQAVFIDAVLLDIALQEWQDSCLGYTEQTRKLYIREVEKFLEFLNGQVIYISDLTTLHINSYLNSLMKRGLVNKTVNNALCAIKSLCSFISENYKISNPAVGIRKLHEDDVEANFWTEQEYQKVLLTSPDFVRPWIRFIASTGLRATEFCHLRWRNCDLKQRTVTVIGKGRKRRTIGLNNTALGILKDQKQKW